MKAPLSEFLMEDWLERHRFSAIYNAGESGHRPQSLGTLLSGLQPDFNFDLHRALNDVLLCDAPNIGFADLRAEVARLHDGATADHVLITTGTSEALLLLLRQLKPRKVAIITPAFQLLSEIPRSLGAEIVALPLDWSCEGRPSAPIGEWVTILGRTKPDVFIFNHPHNPSGLVFTEKQRASLLEVCDAVGCSVIGDEHYRFLAEPSANLKERVEMGPTIWKSHERRFVTGSFIKCAGTPGLRIGWCVGDPRTLAAMQSEKNYLTHTVNPVSQLIAFWFLQSFARDQSFFLPLYQEWNVNRILLEQWLSENSYWCGSSPQGGLVSCLFPRSDLADPQLFEMLREQGIFLLPLSSFMETDMTDVGFSRGFRIGLGTAPRRFKEMLSVMVR